MENRTKSLSKSAEGIPAVRQPPHRRFKPGLPRESGQMAGDTAPQNKASKTAENQGTPAQLTEDKTSITKEILTEDTKDLHDSEAKVEPIQTDPAKPTKPQQNNQINAQFTEHEDNAIDEFINYIIDRAAHDALILKQTSHQLLNAKQEYLKQAKEI